MPLTQNAAGSMYILFLSDFLLTPHGHACAQTSEAGLPNLFPAPLLHFFRFDAISSAIS